MSIPEKDYDKALDRIEELEASLAAEIEKRREIENILLTIGLLLDSKNGSEYCRSLTTASSP